MARPIKFKMAPTPSRPFEVVSMDFLGPLPRTDSRKKYILAIIDLYSRFVTLKSTETKESAEVIDALNETFSVLGYPDTLLSDNALEFVSEGLYKYVHINSVKKAEIATYAAWSNGIVERNNAKINKLLRLYVNSVDNNWDMYLDTVANTINNSLNEVLSDTPAYTLLHYDTLPNIQRTELKDVYNYDSLESIITLREKRAIQISDEIHENIARSRHKRMEKLNKKLKDRTIEVGNRVCIKNHAAKNKLSLRFIGPGTVVEKNNNKLSIRIGNKVHNKIHINHVILLH